MRRGVRRSVGLAGPCLVEHVAHTRRHLGSCIARAFADLGLGGYHLYVRMCSCDPRRPQRSRTGSATAAKGYVVAARMAARGYPCMSTASTACTLQGYSNWRGLAPARMTAQETCQRERSTLVPATLGRLWVESEALGHTSSLSATGFSCRSSPPHACVQPLHQCGDARGSD
jgi:hypothetical protein